MRDYSMDSTMSSGGSTADQPFWREMALRLTHEVNDLQTSYQLAMHLVKAASPEALDKVLATHKKLAQQDELPSTRDLVRAMLQRH